MLSSEIVLEHIVNVHSKAQMLQKCDEVFHLINTAYGNIGGHLNFQKPEDLLDTDYWKLISRDGRLVAGCLYKIAGKGRKQVALCHDGTRQGKLELRNLMREDMKQKRMWGEVSGAAAKSAISLGLPPIPNEYAEKILNKPILAKHGRFQYDRVIAGQVHTKMLVGYPEGLPHGTTDFSPDEVKFNH